MNVIESTTPLVSKEQFAISKGVTVACVNLWITQRKIAPVKVGRRALIPADAAIPVKVPKIKEAVND